MELIDYTELAKDYNLEIYYNTIYNKIHIDNRIITINVTKNTKYQFNIDNDNDAIKLNNTEDNEIKRIIFLNYKFIKFITNLINSGINNLSEDFIAKNILVFGNNLIISENVLFKLSTKIILIYLLLDSKMKILRISEEHTFIFIDSLNVLLENIEEFENILFSKNDNKKKKYKTYIMYDLATCYYKIGKSVSTEMRERTLASQMPKIKTILISDNNIESDLHKKYKEKRIRGEWFNLNADDILDLIEIYGFKKV